jgi:tetratricopeptide (TPR) repeat protein
MKPEEIASVANSILSPALASESSDSHFEWANLESWSELDTLSVPQQHAQPIPESSAHATWSGDSMQHLDTWAALGQPVQSKPEPELEVWEEPQEKRDLSPVIADDEETIEEQPWYQAEHVVEQGDESIGTWNSLSSLSSLPSIDTWETESRETDIPSPPAWLDMLTRGDGDMSARLTPSPVEQEPLTVSPASSQPPAEPASNTQVPSKLETELQPEQEEEPAFFFASDDKDADMGWPEWLKSLGAATMEPEPEQEAGLLEALTVVPELQPNVPSTPWLDSVEQENSVAQAFPANEQQLVTSLENLEYDLHSQGFVPLEPGSLSTIAQEYQEQVPTLSSALAQLGDLTQQPATPKDASQPTQLADASQHAQVTRVFSEETIEPPQAATPTPSPVSESVRALSNTTLPEPVSISPSAEPFFSPASEPVPVSNASTAGEPSLLPAYRADALLENELETTMKRPSIRLQPMQQRSSAQQEQSVLVNKGHAGERGGTSKTSDSNLSYKERLLKGYHAQLDGAYDDAMQEYRIIIRNAPELLGEVISNLRALLKLVPRYAIGYRVLGDAYMRQGEYLQAMEAYNKALTMAKKAKGQGSS